jgi:chorismate mutase
LPASVAEGGTPCEAHAEQCAALLEAMRRRLAIMHDVAHWKWRHDRPIADPPREQALLDDLVAKAVASHPRLDAALVRRFFSAQFEAARLVQEGNFARWRAGEPLPQSEPPDLAAELRPQIDAVSGELVDRLAVLAPAMERQNLAAEFRRQAAEGLTGDGIDEAVRSAALAPLLVAPPLDPDGLE